MKWLNLPSQDEIDEEEKKKMKEDIKRKDLDAIFMEMTTLNESFSLGIDEIPVMDAEEERKTRYEQKERREGGKKILQGILCIRSIIDMGELEMSPIGLDEALDMGGNLISSLSPPFP